MPGEIHINGRSLTAPLLVAPGFLQPQWIADMAQLAPDALDTGVGAAAAHRAAGQRAAAGRNHQDPARPCADRQIALEAMDLGAACRTYNVLAQEDRAVVALLFP